MGSDWAIGALAFITIGGVLGLSIFHFGFQLRDPKNLEATKTVAKDRESAATAVSSEGTAGRSLRQRLDDAPGIDDDLGRRSGGSSTISDILFDMKWSSVVATMKGEKVPTGRAGDYNGGH